MARRALGPWAMSNDDHCTKLKHSQTDSNTSQSYCGPAPTYDCHLALAASFSGGGTRNNHRPKKPVSGRPGTTITDVQTWGAQGKGQRGQRGQSPEVYGKAQTVHHLPLSVLLLAMDQRPSRLEVCIDTMRQCRTPHKQVLR